MFYHLKQTWFFFLVLVVLLTGCNKKKNSDDQPPPPPGSQNDKQPSREVIRLGFVDADQGKSQAFESLFAGFQQAFDVADTTDFRFLSKLVRLDDSFDVDGKDLTEVLRTEKIQIAFGGVTSDGARRLDEAATLLRIPVLSVVGVPRDQTDQMPWTFTLAPPPQQMARAFGRSALARFRGAKMAVLINSSQAGAAALAKAFISGVVPFVAHDQQLPLPFVSQNLFDPNVGADRQLRRIRAAGATVIFVASDPVGMARVEMEAREILADNITLLGVCPDGRLGAFQDTAHSVELALPLSLKTFEPDTPVPFPGLYEALGHDVAQVVLYMLKQATSAEGTHLRDQASFVRNISGKSGPLSLNQQGWATDRSFIIVQLKSGTSKVIAIETARSD